jgi:hypothetical protein
MSTILRVGLGPQENGSDFCELCPQIKLSGIVFGNAVVFVRRRFGLSKCID